MPAVTIATMIRLEENKPINLPADFLETLRPQDVEDVENPYAIMIAAPKTKMIKILSTKGPEVVKASIEIGELSPDFLQELGIIFMRSKIKTIYCTGLNFGEDYCSFEGYLNSSDLTISQEQFKDELAEIRGVSKVDLQTLVA